MIWNIAEIAAALIECFLIMNFLMRFLGLKNKKYSFLKFTVGFLAIAANGLLLPIINTSELLMGVVSLVICFIYSIFFLKGDVYIKIFAVFTSNVLILIINSLVLTGFSKIYNSGFEELIMSRNAVRFEILLITKFLYFLFTQIILVLCRKKEYELNKTEWTAVLTVFLTTLVGTAAVFEIMLSQYSDIACVILLIGLVLINLSVYFFMIKISIDNREKTHMKLLGIQLSEQKDRICEINEMYGEILQIRHDMKKCISCVGALIRCGDYKEAEEYLEMVSGEKIGTVNEYIMLKSSVVSAVINSKLSQCRRENIEITVTVSDCIKNFSETDVSILLANLFDNAIEACRKTEKEKYINFLMEQYMGYVKILMKNSAPEGEMKNTEFKTTKQDRKNHGYGIKTIKEIAEKYEGMHDFIVDEGKFTADIWLKIPD
jgi:hypothetical protein